MYDLILVRLALKWREIREMSENDITQLLTNWISDNLRYTVFLQPTFNFNRLDYFTFWLTFRQTLAFLRIFENLHHYLNLYVCKSIRLACIQHPSVTLQHFVSYKLKRPHNHATTANKNIPAKDLLGVLLQKVDCIQTIW